MHGLSSPESRQLHATALHAGISEQHSAQRTATEMCQPLQAPA